MSAAASQRMDPCSAAGASMSQQLAAYELRAELDQQTIALLQQQIMDLKAALEKEEARGETHAEVVATMGRLCDDRARDMETQHAAALTRLEHAHGQTIAGLRADMDALRVQSAGVKAGLEERLAKAEAENAALESLSASTLTDIHAIVAGLQPRQGMASSVPCMMFDRAWCDAVCGGGNWQADIDAVTGRRAFIAEEGRGFLTLRSAAPLPRQQQLSSFRIIIDAFPNREGTGLLRVNQSVIPDVWCHVGFIPGSNVSATSATSPVVPTAGQGIKDYRGWYIKVRPCHDGGDWKPSREDGGWKALRPASPGASDVSGMKAEAAASTSAYATTTVVPPVPPGSAVEFAVDYAAGTCRVAFYAPGAVSGGFVEAPYAKMELQFIAEEAVQANWLSSGVPARLVPAVANSDLELYPAVTVYHRHAICRFAPV